jgi:seryl-tRNA synthetase
MIRKLQAQMQSIQAQINSLMEKRRRRKDEEKKSKKVKVDKDLDLTPMTYEEKVELSKDISNLPAEKLGKIIEIIHSNVPDLKPNNDDQEIELEIDRLDIKTLRLLERYINEVKVNELRCLLFREPKHL